MNTHSTPFGGQEQLWLIIQMLHYNPSSNTAPGLQTVSGLTSRKISPRVKKLVRLLLGLYKCFHTSTGPLRVFYIYIHVRGLYTYILFHIYSGLMYYSSKIYTQAYH